MRWTIILAPLLLCNALQAAEITVCHTDPNKIIPSVELFTPLNCPGKLAAGGELAGLLYFDEGLYQAYKNGWRLLQVVESSPFGERVAGRWSVYLERE